MYARAELDVLASAELDVFASVAAACEVAVFDSDEAQPGNASTSARIRAGVAKQATHLRPGSASRRSLRPAIDHLNVSRARLGQRKLRSSSDAAPLVPEPDARLACRKADALR